VPKKKKPSFSKILFGVLGTSIIWIIVTFIPAGISIYQFSGGNINMLNEYPSWIWLIPLAVYIIVVATRSIYLYRKEISENRTLKTRARKAKGKSNKADNDSIVMQDVKDSPVYKDSFNISDSFHNKNTPSEFYIPTANELKHKIGIDVQKFIVMFRNIHHTRKQEQIDKYNEANEHLKTKVMDLIHQANLILEHTEIPRLMNELYNYFQQYWHQIGMLRADYEEYWSYVGANAEVPPETKKDIEILGEKIDNSIRQVELIAQQLIDLCKEKNN